MISVVVPVFNESPSLETLCEELFKVARENEYLLDLVLVDDGSTDDTWQVIERLAAGDQRIRGIRFRRNFGKAAALSAGFEAAEGKVVFTLDADLQDDPHEIPRLLAKMDEGSDVVSGWKRTRHDPWHKVIASRIFNRLVSAMTGVQLHDHNCGFKCYRREIFDEVRLYGELHRFVPVLAAARGWRVSEVEVAHRPREFGHSKYGWARIPKGFLDLITVKFLTGFGQRPQHLLGTAGLICFATGTVMVFGLMVAWVSTRIIDSWAPIHLHQRAVFYCALGLVMLGVQFMSIGILAELFTAYTSRNMPSYSISDRTGGPWTARPLTLPSSVSGEPKTSHSAESDTGPSAKAC